MSTKIYDRKKQKFVTKSGGGAVSLGSLQSIAASSILGRISAGDGVVEVLTASQVKILLDLAGITSAVVNAKSPINSPAFTGIPTAPTAAPGTNTTQLATAEFVATAIANLVASSPAALDTLNELAAALGNDANFSTTVTNSLANKQALSTLLTAIAALSPTNNYAIVGNGSTFVTQPHSLTGVGYVDTNTINTSTANYVFTATDLDTQANGSPVRRMNVSTANTLTIPNDTTLGLSGTVFGQRLVFSCVGAGQTTIAASAGVTVAATPGLKLRDKPSYGTALRIAANTWDVFGDLSA